jgi:hypothetical protein
MSVKQKKVNKSVKPLKNGCFRVMNSQDEQAWVVSGHRCAARVPKQNAQSRDDAAIFALNNPELWIFG